MFLSPASKKWRFCGNLILIDKYLVSAFSPLFGFIFFCYYFFDLHQQSILRTAVIL